MQFEKIQNNGPKVPELVMDSLLKAMEAGTIRVGEELPPERDLAEALGISRNSLRECLAILSFMGIVENRGNRKILVKYADRFRKARSLIDLSYSQDTFEDFMEFRRTNEREIARLACASGRRRRTWNGFATRWSGWRRMPRTSKRMWIFMSIWPMPATTRSSQRC